MSLEGGGAGMGLSSAVLSAVGAGSILRAVALRRLVTVDVLAEVAA